MNDGTVNLKALAKSRHFDALEGTSASENEEFNINPLSLELIDG